MTDHIHHIAEGFSAAAQAYRRGRPSYPEDAVNALCRHLGLSAGDRVADLGAGTGTLSRLLADRGLDVIAVEPVRSMRAALDGTPGITVTDGTAERTGLADRSVSAVVAAQAWHWFDGPKTLTEAARILLPGGGLGTIRNDMDLSEPWVARVRQIRRVAQPVGYPAYDRKTLLADVDAAPGWAEPSIRSFSYLHHTSHQGVADRVLSTSYVAALPDAERDRIAVDVLAAIAEQPADIDFPYLTEVVTCLRTAR